jgi:signal transduction histidine kinase
VVVVIATMERILTRSAVMGTEERLTQSTQELADVTQTGIRQGVGRYVATARHRALVRALAVADRPVRSAAAERALVAAARKVLARLVLPNDSGMVVELWSAAGRRVTYVGTGASLVASPNNPALGARAILREAIRGAVASDSLRLSRLYVTGGRVYFWLVQPVEGRHGTVGYIAHERRIASNREADQSARALAGGRVVMYYGNADGTVWSTVGGRPATPALPRIAGANTAGSSREQVLTASATISGTPLQIMMQSQLDEILEAPRSVLRKLALVGTLLIAAGMGAALLIGRRVTRPIVAIANAAEAIARGEYDVRVPDASEAEIARLIESFNHMAIQVAAAEETRRVIAHMGRVATVAELGASVAHEMRQPLTAIRANAEAGLLLLGRIPADLDEALDTFRSIVADSDRAAEVINHIRLLLRKESGAATTVDLNDICREALHLLQPDAALRRTNLELSLAPTSPTVLGDPVQLQQVVLNLTLNALDAASTMDRQRQVTVSTSVAQGVAEIAIRDNGPGIPAEVQQRLFQPFFTTKTQGLGMGLAIVRSIVERHHGRVRAENVSAGGAAFKVTLPVSSPPVAAPATVRMIGRLPSSFRGRLNASTMPSATVTRSSTD